MVMFWSCSVCYFTPVLLPVLFDGLLWCSRLSENGKRRVNYYLKHLLVDEDNKALNWIAALKEVMHPILVRHPVERPCLSGIRGWQVMADVDSSALPLQSVNA